MQYFSRLLNSRAVASQGHGEAGAKAPSQQKISTAAGQASTVGIDVVINAVRDALKEAQNNNVPNFPPLKSVEITLSTVASKEGGAKFKILVFSIDTTGLDESASTIKLTMQPPTTKQGTSAAVNPANYEKALAAALNMAKEGVVAANRAGPPNLITSNIEIEIKFTVTGKGGGGISLEPIGLDLSGKLSKSQIHTLKLVFGKGS